MRFKVGDKIKCVKQPHSVWSYTLGKVYVVTGDGPQNDPVVRSDDGSWYLINPAETLNCCFELYSETPKAEPVTNSFWD
jgi:hypothetical protein